jgi:hypothetical protein
MICFGKTLRATLNDSDDELWEAFSSIVDMVVTTIRALESAEICRHYAAGVIL